MPVEPIEISVADGGFRAHFHDDSSTQNLVECIYLDDTPSTSGSETDLESIGWKPGVKEWLVLSCVLLIAIMDAFDATMIIPIVPALSAVFEQPLRSALWINTSYLLAHAASQPLFAMLSEVFGQGPILIASVVIATAGTGVCSGSLDLPCLIAGRLVQGAGSGGAMAVSLLVITDLIPYPHSIRFLDYICWALAVGAVLGPLLGGIFGQYVDWTWGFYSSYVFCALALLLIPFAIDLRECKSISRQAAREMDWLGAILIPVGLGCLLIGVSWVGRPPSGWDDWRIVVLSCVGGLVMLVLVLHESIWGAQPMFNLGIFNSVSTIMLYVGSFLQGLLLLCHLQNLSLYLCLVRHLSSALSGLGILGITAPVVPALLLTAKVGLIHHPRCSRWIIRAGWAVNLIASGCFILLDANISAPGWVFILFASGVSHALLVSGYNASSHTGSVVHKEEGQGEGEIWIQPTRGSGRVSSPAFAVLMYSILRTWGMCIAVPVSGTIVLTQMAQKMGRYSVEPPESLVRLVELMLSRDDKEELGLVFLEGFGVVWWVFMGMSALGGISSLLIR